MNYKKLSLLALCCFGISLNGAVVTYTKITVAKDKLREAAKNDPSNTNNDSLFDAYLSYIETSKKFGTREDNAKDLARNTLKVAKIDEALIKMFEAGKQVKGLEKKVEIVIPEIKEDLNEIAAQAKAEKEIEENLKKIAAQAKVADLAKRLADERVKINAAKTDEATRTANLKNLRDKVAHLSNRIAGLKKVSEQEIANLSTQIQDLQITYKKLGAEVAQISNVQKKNGINKSIDEKMQKLAGLSRRLKEIKKGDQSEFDNLVLMNDEGLYDISSLFNEVNDQLKDDNKKEIIIEKIIENKDNKKDIKEIIINKEKKALEKPLPKLTKKEEEEEAEFFKEEKKDEPKIVIIPKVEPKIEPIVEAKALSKDELESAIIAENIKINLGQVTDPTNIQKLYSDYKKLNNANAQFIKDYDVIDSYEN